MAKLDDIFAQMRTSPANVRFADLKKSVGIISGSHARKAPVIASTRRHGPAIRA